MSLVAANVVLFPLNKIWQELSNCWDGRTIICRRAPWFDADCRYARRDCRVSSPTYSVADRRHGSKL